MERTLIQLKSDFADMADKHKQINSFFWGDFVDAINQDAVDYPLMVCTLQPSQIGDSYTGVDLQIIIADKYIEQDYRMVDEVHSDCLRILKDIDVTLKQFRFTDYLDVETDLSTEPFINRGHDVTAGWAGLFRMRVHDYENRCAIPYDGFNFDESTTGTGCPSGVVVITDDEGNSLYTVTVDSNGSETQVIGDSTATINTNEATFSINAEGSQNINALDSNGDPLTVSGVSGDDVSFDVAPYRPFIFTVKTDNPGVTANNQYKIPVNSFTGFYYDVETSDGQFFTKQTGALTITFPTAGTYDIKIKYGYIRYGFNGSDDRDKLIDVKQFGDVVVNIMERGFYLCQGLTNVTAVDTPIILDDLARAVFQGNNNLVSINNINNWDIINIKRMDNFFAFCGNFSADLSDWNIVNVSNFTKFALRCTFTTPDYDATLIGWEATLQAEYPGGAGYPHTISIDFGSSQYTAGGAADTARASLISNFGWTIADGGSV